MLGKIIINDNENENDNENYKRPNPPDKNHQMQVSTLVLDRLARLKKKHKFRTYDDLLRHDYGLPSNQKLQETSTEEPTKEPQNEEPTEPKEKVGYPLIADFQPGSEELAQSEPSVTPEEGGTLKEETDEPSVIPTSGISDEPVEPPTKHPKSSIKHQKNATIDCPHCSKEIIRASIDACKRDGKVIFECYHCHAPIDIADWDEQ